jgi:hypothetical protein
MNEVKLKASRPAAPLTSDAVFVALGLRALLEASPLGASVAKMT